MAKINGANMLASGKHAKVSTVTFLSDLRFRGQRSNLSNSPIPIRRSNYKQRQIVKLLVPTCWPWTNMQKFPWWPFGPELALGRLVCHVCMTSLFWFHVSNYHNFWNNERWKSVLNTLASWNCFTCRNLLQNGANDMSECLTFETAFCKKAQNFV